MNSEISLYIVGMNRWLFWIFCGFSLSLHAQNFTVAFGSCSNQKFDLSIFDTILTHDPDVMILLGDNVYLDTYDKSVMCAKYDSLLTHPSFHRLQERVSIWPVWDDHDYGWNDAGKEYSEKELTKLLLFDAFDEPASSCRWKRPGIYGEKIVERNGLRVQFLLLDTRSFRDSLCVFNETPMPKNAFTYWPEYSPCSDTTRTLLGTEQWNWLRDKLSEPADYRIVCSSIQFGHAYNGYESWNNFPWEKERLIRIIRETRAQGVVFISGDVHYGEISKDTANIGYPIYDITSSGLSSTWHSAAPNANRVGEPIMENNFGLLQFTEKDQKLVVQLIDKSNRIRETIILDKNQLTAPTFK